MKKLIVLILCCALLDLHAQDRRDTEYIYAGIALRPDAYVPVELDLKYLQKKGLSGGLRFTTFNYLDWAGSAEVNSPLTRIQDNVRFDYYIRGFTLKPGIIPFKWLMKRAVFSVGLYGVATYAKHDFTFIYNDAAGITREKYSRTVINYGLETDLHLGWRIFKSVTLGSSFILGYKQTNVPVFQNQVAGMKTYRRYTPAQGFNRFPIYANVMATLGYNF